MRIAGRRSGAVGGGAGDGRQTHGLGVATEVVDGREVYHLKLTLASGAVRNEFLDVGSLYLVRSITTRQISGRPVEVTTAFGDFKKTKGVVFPRRIDVEAAGRPNRLHVVVDEIEINPDLSDARFTMVPASRP